MHTLWLFFSWPAGATWSNVLAMPACGLVAVMSAVVFRKPLSRWWHRLVGEHAGVEDIRRAADAAHRIAADLFEHHTGRRHPDAPGNGDDRGTQG